MGFKKTLSDIIIIARIYYLQFRDQLGKYLFSGLLIPLASFFMASATAGQRSVTATTVLYRCHSVVVFYSHDYVARLYSYRGSFLRKA